MNLTHLLLFYNKYNVVINILLVILSIYLIIQINFINIFISFYLGYNSVKVIENDNINDIKLIMKRWICFSICLIFETFVYPIRTIYTLAKICVLMWLYYSDSNLDNLYSNYVCRLYSKNDYIMDSMAVRSNEYMQKVFVFGKDFRNICINLLVSNIDKDTIQEIIEKK